MESGVSERSQRFPLESAVNGGETVTDATTHLSSAAAKLGASQASSPPPPADSGCSFLNFLIKSGLDFRNVMISGGEAHLMASVTQI